MSIFKKIPKWCWYVFPIAIVLILFFALRGGGRGVRSWLTPSSSVDPTAPPALSPEKAEEKREEIKEETATEKEKIKEKYDKERDRVDAWLRGDS